MFFFIMNNNPLKNIDSEKKIAPHVKAALVAEIETIRVTSVLVELFVGNFINTFTKSIDINTEQEQSEI